MTEIPSRLLAALEGRYTLERQLGEGGMATVYLAHDVRHDRKVALKVLRPELAAVMGAERFLAEIRTTANLRHPHILPLFDSGEADGLVFYVMPYVEGESLRARLDKERQLPVEEAVRVAVAVARALEHAHRHGVIHRDIKPANILLEDGQPVVADFGIALAVTQAGGGRITETGLSLGTPHYMSPEQATGEKTLNARTDVYALGCVLYEMLAGDPPHGGSSAQAVLSRILTEEPRHVTDVRRSVPLHVSDAVAKALEKVPADRFESAEAFARALEDPAFRHEATAVAGMATSRRSGARAGAPTALTYRSQAPLFALGTLALIASGAAVLGWLREAPAAGPQPVMRAYLEVPGGFSGSGQRQLTISRDGAAIAYQGFGADRRGVIYVRRSHEVEARPVPGTEGNSQHPEFSPDGQWIAFLRGDSLLKVSLAGGPPLLLTRQAGGQLEWGSNGFIYFTAGGAVVSVPDVGGARDTVLTRDTTGIFYRSPELLPDGEALLFTAYGSSLEDAEIRLLELATGEVRTLVRPGSHPHYVSTGHIVYGHPERALFALPFDLGRHEVTGQPVPVLPLVSVAFSGVFQFDVAENGTAVYREAGPGNPRELVIVRRGEAAERLSVEPGGLLSPRYSPDGRRIAFRRAPDIYVHDLDLGTTLRLTSEGDNWDPVWSEDGRWVTFNARRPGTLTDDGFRQPADGSAEAEPLFRLAGTQTPLEWTPDGRLLMDEVSGRGRDLVVVSFEGDSVVVAPYLRANWNEMSATLSPDGRWAAYTADETGRNEVYVRPFPEATAGKWQMSESGGQEPSWSPDGRTLYYWEGTDLRAASIRTEPTFNVVSRETVLSEQSRVRGDWFSQYDVHPDGESFLIVRTQARSGETTPRFTVAVNWFEELKARTGANPRR